jgi:hypothetical protein
MRTVPIMLLLILAGTLSSAQTTHYYRVAPILNGAVQSARIDQKVIVKMKKSDYYDLEIIMDHRDENQKVITQVHLESGSLKKSRSGRKTVVSQYGITQDGDRVRIIYPTDRTSFWLVTGFYPDGRIKTGAVYEK